MLDGGDKFVLSNNDAEKMKMDCEPQILNQFLLNKSIN